MMIIMVGPIGTPIVGASCSIPLPSTQLHPVLNLTLAPSPLPHAGSLGNHGGAKRKEK